MAARRAGHTPNATPTNAEKAKAIITAVDEICVRTETARLAHDLRRRPIAETNADHSTEHAEHDRLDRGTVAEC